MVGKGARVDCAKAVDESARSSGTSRITVLNGTAGGRVASML